MQTLLLFNYTGSALKNIGEWFLTDLLFSRNNVF